MRKLLLVAFLFGCGRKELVVSEKDVFFSESITSEKTDSVKTIIPAYTFTSDDSTREIIWPDDRPLKFLHWVSPHDTHGNNISIALRVELQQVVDDSVFETITLVERTNYIIHGDTLIIAADRLKSLNIKTGEEYTYLWKFRYRAENAEAFEKFSDWSYSNLIHLMDAEKLWGVPHRPNRLKIIR